MIKIRCPYANMQPNPKIARRMAKEDIENRVLENLIREGNTNEPINFE